VIEEKLEEARLRSAKRRMQVIIVLLITICLCGLLLVGVSFFDFSAKKKVPVEASVASIKENLSESDREKARGEFKESLQQYENELEPRLLRANVELWNRDGFFEINELKRKAILSFTNGEYSNALVNLQSLKSRTVKILAEAEHIFQENMRQASSFLAEDLYDEAKFHLEKALMVAPQSPEVLELQQQVEKLPTLLPLLNGVKVARSENDLQKEYDFLQQVLHLAPEREEDVVRLKALEGLIKNQKFAAHIASGFVSIEKSQAKEARNHYRQAQKIDPERAELSVLLGQLLALEKSLRVQQAVKQAELAVRRDDWQQAKDNCASAVKDAPDNKTVVDGLKRAEEILGFQVQFSQYIKNPYRLAHTDVRREAEKTLKQAETASGYSFALKRQAEQLTELIVKLNRPVPVTVISDNKTSVSVRSVGKVGAVSQKTVHLKPGNYTFEGARDGFKSKLVQAFIPYDRDNLSVRVICDEPI
jgi:tetratricopeptide (TPR) repeat protein